jgi:hypothetical protein
MDATSRRCRLTSRSGRSPQSVRIGHRRVQAPLVPREVVGVAGAANLDQFRREVPDARKTLQMRKDFFAWA